MMRSRRSKRAVGTALAVVWLAGIVAPVAMGQAIAVDPHDLYRKRHFNYWKWIARPQLSRSEFLEVVDEIEGVTDAQRTILGGVYDDFIAQFREASTEIRVIADGVNNRVADESGRNRFRPEKQSTWTPYPQFNWEIRRHKLETALFTDVAVILDGDQRDAWAWIARRIRRDKWFPIIEQDWWGFPVADLTRVFESIPLGEAERDTVGPVIEEYEIAVDEILQRMERDRARLQIEQWRLSDADQHQTDPGTRERREEILAQQQGMIQAIVQLNARIRDRILAVLPPERHDLFRDAYGLATHPQVYAPSPADLAIHHLNEIESVPPETRDRITAIAARYAPRRRTILNQLEKTARERVLHPEKFEQDWAELGARFQAWQEATRSNPDVFMVYSWEGLEPWRERYLLVRNTCRDLRRVFGPEEFEALPAHIRLLLDWVEE